MKKNQSRWLFVFALGAILLGLAGCDSAGGGGGTAVRTIRWEQDGSGNLQFYTNDSDNQGAGYIYHLDTQASSTPVPDTVVQCSKLSGSDDMGYGMVFDYDDNSGDFSRVLITLSGYVQVAQKTGGSYSYLQSFTASPHINTTPGDTNEIRANINSNTLTVYINGEQVFQDSTYQPQSGARAGFYVGVGTTTENFPSEPVDTRFELNQPVSYP